METLNLLLSRYNNWDNEVSKIEYIDMLENYLNDILEKYANEDEVIEDSIYNTLIDILKEVKPDSELLKHVWSKDDEDAELDEDLDICLIKYPMLSICTIKSMLAKELLEFKRNLSVVPTTVCCSVKLNGHGIRLVYNKGSLVKAHSRGRNSNGRDLTRQLRIIVGDNNVELENYGIVEIRGELVLPFDNMEDARKFNPKIKSPFTGVSSMSRGSASEEEVKLLKFVAYDVLFGEDQEDVELDTLSGKFEFLSSCGFDIPKYFLKDISRNNFDSVIEDILFTMDVETTDYAYFCDGVVVAVDDLNLFDEFGAEDTYRLGNIALKMGKWAQDYYTGTIIDISWEYGKKKKTPVAIIEPTLTSNGSSVSRVPLYAPYNILILEAYKGKTINFRYGGESGVVPITADGRLVTDAEVRQKFDFSNLENLD